MIRINLLGDDTVVDTSGTWVWISYVFCVVVIIGSAVAWNMSLGSSNEALALESDGLERRLASIREITKEVQDLGKKKVELAERTTIISTLKKGKFGPVRVLDDLNSAIPERAWLTDMKENGGLMRINGVAIDHQTVAAFVRQLESSRFFHGVTIGETRGDDKSGVKVVKFSLQAQVKYSGFPVEAKASPSPVLSPAAS